MSSVSAKELHRETNAVLDRVERGETVIVTNDDGYVIGRIEPENDPPTATWGEVMKEVNEARKRVKPHEVQPNPVLVERTPRRR